MNFGHSNKFIFRYLIVLICISLLIKMWSIFSCSYLPLFISLVRYLFRCLGHLLITFFVFLIFKSSLYSLHFFPPFIHSLIYSFIQCQTSPPSLELIYIGCNCICARGLWWGVAAFSWCVNSVKIFLAFPTWSSRKSGKGIYCLDCRQGPNSRVVCHARERRGPGSTKKRKKKKKSSLHILGNSPLSYMCFADIFPWSVVCFLIILTVCFLEQNFKKILLMKSSL